MKAVPWEMGAVLLASVAALAFGLLHLGEPSLWHDELVHAYVAKSLAETGRAALPGGEPYYNGTVYNVLLAGIIKLFGMSEFALRAPSAIFGAINVALTFFVLRPLLGRNAALIAAAGLALSPWAVAWSREARFYTLQQTFYLIFVGACWRLVVADDVKRAAPAAVLALTAYVLAVLTSYHSLLFLAGPGAFAAAMWMTERRWQSRWTWLVVGMGIAGVASLGIVRELMNAVDRQAVVDNSGLGGGIVDAARSHRMYYTHWLRMNLSTGFFLLALFGYVAMLVKARGRGFYAALAFWAPVLILTFLIGYRRPRFMFFAYPFFVAAWAYGLVVLVDWLRQAKPDWPRRVAALAVVLFFVRLAVSGVALVADSAEAASGAHTTLARRHPQWKAPCAWVREHRGDAAVITTTFLPVHHYVGRVESWYPSRGLPHESAESGLEGLAGVEELKDFIEAYPKGYFLAEWWRFERNAAGAPWGDFSEDIAWVQAHMTRVDEASSEDVTVYAWDFTQGAR